MKTPQDLIKRLNDEASKFHLFHLVVGFKSECQFVAAYDPEAEQLRKLNQLVLAGGIPIGFLGIRSEARIGKVCTGLIVTQPLTEFHDEPHIRQMLDIVAEVLADSLEKTGAMVRVDKSRPDLN